MFYDPGKKTLLNFYILLFGRDIDLLDKVAWIFYGLRGSEPHSLMNFLVFVIDFIHINFNMKLKVPRVE